MANYDGEIRINSKIDTSGFNKGVNNISGSLGGLKGVLGKIAGLVGTAFAVNGLVNFGKEAIGLASDLQEVENVVTTAFGSMAGQVEDWAAGAIRQFGMSELAAKQTASTYMAMSRGMGLVGQAAADMSMDLAGLSADMASFYNVEQDVASTALQSIWTGETESLKKFGVVMTQTNLNAYALKNGYGKLISEMTQAEQVQLRYAYVTDALSLAAGDFAKTSNSWANQTRILSMNIQALGANIGSILTTVLLPAVKTLNELVNGLVSATSVISAAISSIFGVQISQNSAIASSAADAAAAETALADGISSAASAAKKSTAGFDELNVLQGSTGSGGGGGSGGGAANMSFANETAMTDSEAIDPSKIERAAELIKEIASYVPVIAAGLGGLKLGKFITDLLTANMEAKTLKETIALWGKKAGLTLGITLAVTGIALEAKGIISTIQEGLNGINFAEILGGGGVLAGGGALIGQFFGEAILGGAIGGVVAGVPAFIAGVYDSLVNGIDWLSAALTAVGGAAAGAGISVILTALGTAVAPGIGTLIGLAVGLVTDLVILIVQNWDAIVAWCGEACAAIGQFFSDLWQNIVGIWNICAEWFDTNVIQPVVGFFAGLWEGISTAASDCWASIVEFFTPAFEWFSALFGNIWQTISDIFYNIGVIASGCWEVIQAVWAVVSQWFSTNIIQPVANFFTGLWESISNLAIGAWDKIKGVFSTIGNWINTNIIQPVSNFFAGLWNGFLDKARGAWNAVKSVFGNVASFFSDTFKKAWEGIVKVFSIAGNIFTDIKDGILNAFKSIVNGIIRGLNSAIAVPFNGINSALQKIRSISILGLTPFSALKTISVPQIPLLAQGAVLPANKPFLAVVGDQKNGTNIEAPLETIKQALSEVLDKQGGEEIKIMFTGDLAQLGRVLKPVIDKEGRRVGGSLAKGAY